ncbi:MAG: GNAT family N-acetyltransferase [Clostridiales bacterium]|jgi:predicted acetyltransferase|nr:GNAT family N-acetyltransferase [Clostridiales bacterium]
MKSKPEKIKLKTPSLEMKNYVMAFREEFLQSGEKNIQGSCDLHRYDDFNEWLKNAREIDLGLNADLLPATTYFAVRLSDGVIVGVANIRRYLREEVYHNGHIGYSVRPSERRGGYGTEILRLALIKAEQLGIIEPVVSCKKSNRASKRVILNNGLLFEREHPEADGDNVLIYHKP